MPSPHRNTIQVRARAPRCCHLYDPDRAVVAGCGYDIIWAYEAGSPGYAVDHWRDGFVGVGWIEGEFQTFLEADGGFGCGESLGYGIVGENGGEAAVDFEHVGGTCSYGERSWGQVGVQ